MYKESIDKGNKYRHEYRKGIESLIGKLNDKSEMNRAKTIDAIKKDAEKSREKFVKMLGWPLGEELEKEPPKVKNIFVFKKDEVSVYRLQIDILDIPFYGLLFVKDDNVRRPLVIVQHGGQGSPEECGGLLESGTANYNDIIDRVLKYDVNVFAPQLLLWRQEFSDDEYKGVDVNYTDAMRRGIDNRLKQFGSSITALEIYCIKRSIDFFEKQPYVESDKIGMMGLSYGGFYTLYTAAAETRIKCCFSCSFFNDRIKYNWSDWVWFNSGNLFTDLEVALLLQTRPLYICIGDEDEQFDFTSGKRIWKELEKNIACENNIHFIEFHGTHEFIRDDNSIRDFIEDLCK